MKACAFLVAAGLGLISCMAMSQTKNPPERPASQLNRNLLKNGDVEAEGTDSEHVPGWGQKGGLSATAYGSVGGEWDWGLSGCPACGKRYLRLAFEAETHQLSVSQTTDVASLAADIDKNAVTADASAYLGGYIDGDTTGQVTASFQDASGQELGKIQTEPYDTAKLPKPDKGGTGLVFCHVTGKVPAGTKRIVYTWDAHASGDSGDHLGLGDDFSLKLTLQ
jgi:hypothetical protein